MVERCALSGSDLKVNLRTILLTSITRTTTTTVLSLIIVASFGT